MKALYVDNFRGFQDCYIELQPVNFLVGENSSGKTSLLWAARLLLGREFWMNPTFSAREEGLGVFQDIVSAYAHDQTYFKMGFAVGGSALASSGKSGSEVQYFSALVVFDRKEGIPRPSEVRLQLNSSRCIIRVRPKTVLIEVFQGCAVPEKRHFDWNEGSPTHRYEHKARLDPTNPFLFELMDVLSALEKHVKQTESKGNLKAPDRFGNTFSMNPFSALFSATATTAWIAPMRSKPKRTYDEYALEYSADGAHTPYLIQRFLRNRKISKNFREYLESIGTASGLFDGVKIQRFGASHSAPFELDVVLGTKKFSVKNVGYGISQSLPVFVEMFAREGGALFAIQQPEVHLHPRAQASVGDTIFDLVVGEGKQFIVETHSDYLIDRFRMRVCEAKESRVQGQVIFCQHVGGFNVPTMLPIDGQGRLPDDQPEAYRRFFLNESMRALELS